MRWRGILQALGPGLLLAATATGVSHLVQSTRAGAVYGLGIAWAIALANLLKYPFFLFGPRYAAATQESLIEGYRRLGRPYFYLFVLLTVCTMFVIQAAVTLVTAGVASLFLPAVSSVTLGLGLLALCGAILARGHYAWLDHIIKGVVVVLVLSTVTAAALAWRKGHVADPNFVAPSLWTAGGFTFLIALMGWMPAPIDVAVWNSLWTLARQKQTQYRPTLKEESIDFHIGYVGTALLALVFMSLGAHVMYGTSQVFENSASGFARQLSDLYVESMGPWTRPLIVLAAFTTMFSTTLAALDAYVRVLGRSYAVATKAGEDSNGGFSWVALGVMLVGTLLVLTVFKNKMLTLVDVATALSFVSAPILAWMNLRLIQAEHVPLAARPRPWEKILAQIGLAFLSIFTLLFLFIRYTFI